MTPQDKELQNNTSVVTANDLAQRFLGNGIEKDFYKVDEPEIEVDVTDTIFIFSVENMKARVQIGTLSVRILWAGAAIVIANALLAALN